MSLSSLSNLSDSFKPDVVAIRKHNENTFKKLQPGDLIQIHRGSFYHWAVFIGQGRVIHLVGVGDPGQGSFTVLGLTYSAGEVREDDFWVVVGDSQAYINNYLDNEKSHNPPDVIVQKARAGIGPTTYSAVYKNCEQFATLCRYNQAVSRQVRNAVTAVYGGLAVGGPVGAVVAGGALALANNTGLSGK